MPMPIKSRGAAPSRPRLAPHDDNAQPAASWPAALQALKAQGAEVQASADGTRYLALDHSRLRVFNMTGVQVGELRRLPEPPGAQLEGQTGAATTLPQRHGAKLSMQQLIERVPVGEWEKIWI